MRLHPTIFKAPAGLAIRLIPWLIRAAVIGLAAYHLVVPPDRLYPLDPQTVSTEAPAACVHTRLIDEVEEWKIRESLQLVREMGAPTIVEFFPWAYIEYTPGSYDWNQADRIVGHAQEQGIRIIARLGLVPDWARPPDTTLNYIDDSAYPAFARFAAEFATRYAGVIDHLIIWNEPNLAFEWGFQPVDPARYARMLQVVYPAIHAANPAAVVLGGALAPTLEPVGSPHGMNDLLYLQALYDLGAADYFDALAAHAYGLRQPALADPAPDQLNFRRLELLHDIMQINGDGAAPIYLTESGWNDHPRWVHAVRPSQRIAYTLEALRLAEDWAWLETMCLWVLRYPRAALSFSDNFSLVTPEFQRKPIYYAVQAYARGWQPQEALWRDPPAG